MVWIEQIFPYPILYDYLSGTSPGRGRFDGSYGWYGNIRCWRMHISLLLVNNTSRRWVSSGTSANPKEQMLLEDQKRHEEVCIHKYQTYAAQVQDSQLKQLLGSYAQQEQEHLNTINQLLTGQIPSMAQGQQSSTTMTGTTQSQGAANKQDEMLLTDLLMTEKYVSVPIIRLF